MNRADQILYAAERYGAMCPEYASAREAGFLRSQVRSLCDELSPDGLPYLIRGLGQLKHEQVTALIKAVSDLCEQQVADFSCVVMDLQQAIESCADVYAPSAEDVLEGYEAQRIDEQIDERREAA